jgi:alpha-beta hydrolase superfamily lysophospholipase
MQPTLLVLLVALLSSCADSGNKNEGATQTAMAAPAGEAERAADPVPEEPHTAKAVARTRIETIQFPAADGLLVTADLFQWHDEDAPFIVLFHQAGWSRGEYKEIAPKLGEMGFNCMAVDQRSGKGVNQVVNETAKLASAKKLGTSYLDALPDMRASLRLVQSRYPDAKRIAWGSSYSSALVLVLAGNEPELIDAVISFSPGEYFSKLGKGKDFVTKAASKIEQPVFITSAKAEHKSWKAIYAAMPSKNKSSFLPETSGNHGSRALWAKQKDAGAYWAAVQIFLKSL